MHRVGIVVVSCLALGAGAAAHQGGTQGTGAPAGQAAARGPQGPPPTLVAEVQTMFNALKNNISKAAEQFPEDKYAWSPTPDVRSWGQLMEHIIDDNNGACYALAGESTRPTRLDNEGKPTDAGKGLSKADIVRMLGDSFERCDKAFAAVTPDNMTERPGARSKLGALIYDTQHISEHYGNIVTYMRLQGLVPPSSQRAGGRGGRD
jgi:hypothetical protein